MNESLPVELQWQKLAPHVYLTSLFSAAECEKIIEAIERQGPPPDARYDQPNSMQDYGIVLHDDELSTWAGDLVYSKLRTEVARLFSDMPHHAFTDHHAFMTVYGKEQNSELTLHVDASHVTLNVCLHNDAKGAELVFTGNRCRDHVDDLPDRPPALVEFKRGDALLHIGSQRHFVTEIESGSRKNLVIWYRLDNEPLDHTNSWVRADCPVCRRYA